MLRRGQRHGARDVFVPRSDICTPGQMPPGQLVWVRGLGPGMSELGLEFKVNVIGPTGRCAECYFIGGGADVCKQMSYFLLRKIVIGSEEFLPVLQ